MTNDNKKKSALEQFKEAALLNHRVTRTGKIKGSMANAILELLERVEASEAKLEALEKSNQLLKSTLVNQIRQAGAKLDGVTPVPATNDARQEPKIGIYCSGSFSVDDVEKASSTQDLIENYMTNNARQDLEKAMNDAKSKLAAHLEKQAIENPAPPWSAVEAWLPNRYDSTKNIEYKQSSGAEMQERLRQALLEAKQAPQPLSFKQCNDDDGTLRQPLNNITIDCDASQDSEKVIELDDETFDKLFGYPSKVWTGEPAFINVGTTTFVRRANKSGEK